MPMEKPKLDPQLRIEENLRQVCCLEGDVGTPSLCDLPVIELNEDEVPDKRTNEETQDEEDFDFGSLRADGSLLSLDDDMCVADEIFLNGQILPLRHSISSFDKLRDNNNKADTLLRTGSGSLQSLDRCGSMSSSGYRSSNHSTSRSSSTGSTGKSARNPFHSYPSPSPQIRACPGTRTVPTGGPKKPNSKSTLWDLLRRGLVRAPPELAPRRSTSYCHGQKIISRSSSSSSSSTVNDKGSGSTGNGRVKTIPAPGDLSPAGAKKSVGGIFGGCRYSVEVVTNVGCGSAVVAAVEMKRGKTEEERRRRRRTFEWLKGVTDHGGVLNPV